MHPDQLPPVLQTVIARVVKAERRRADRRAEKVRQEVLSHIGEAFVKSVVGGQSNTAPAFWRHSGGILDTADPVSTMLKSLPPETPADRLHLIAAQGGYADTLARLQADEPWEYADLLTMVEDEIGLERVTKADRSHLVRTIITNRLGHRQVVWRKKQEGEEPRGASRGQEGDEGLAKPAPLTREQVAESRTIVANAVADPNKLNPEQVKDLAKHINAVTKEEAKGLLRVLGAKVSGRQMEVAQRLLDTIRAGREKGKGTGDALERAGNKTTGQYGAWGVAAGGTGGKPEAKRDEFPKRGVSAEEAMIERKRLAKEQEQGGKSREFGKEKKRKTRRASDGRSLAAVVKSYGGIDPDSHAFKAHFGSLKEGMEYGLNLGMFKKGGRSFDQMAQELAGAGHIQVADGEDATQYLADQLMKKAASDLYDRKEELQSAEEAYYAALQAAADEQGVNYEPGLTAEELFGDVPGFAEAHRGAEDSAAEAEAGDPYGSSGEGSDTSFDFGNNVADESGLDPAEFDRRMSQLDPRDSGQAPQPDKPRPLTPDDADIEKRRAAGDKLGRMEGWQAERPSVAADEAVGRARERVRAAGGGEVLGDEEEVRAAAQPTRRTRPDPFNTPDAAGRFPSRVDGVSYGDPEDRNADDRAARKQLRIADKHAAEADRIRDQIDQAQAAEAKRVQGVQDRVAAANAKVKELEAKAAQAREREEAAKARTGEVRGASAQSPATADSRPAHEMTPDERKAEIERVRAEYAKVAHIPSLMDGNISPYQLGQMSPNQKKKYDRDLMAKLTLRDRLKELTQPDDVLAKQKEKSDVQAVESEVSGKHSYVQKILSMAGPAEPGKANMFRNAKGNLKPGYQRLVDELNATLEKVAQTHPEIAAKYGWNNK